MQIIPRVARAHIPIMPPEESPDSAPVSFEDALARLEGIVHDLEDGDLGLAEALARYESGVGLLKNCHQLLEKAERRIELLCGFDAEGNPTTAPFDDTESVSLDAERQQRSRKRTASPARKAPVASEPPQIDELPGLF